MTDLYVIIRKKYNLHKFKFYFSVLKRFQSREDLQLNVTEGNNVVLPCQPPESSPSAIIYFEVNGTMIKENTGKIRE